MTTETYERVNSAEDPMDRIGMGCEECDAYLTLRQCEEDHLAANAWEDLGDDGVLCPACAEKAADRLKSERLEQLEGEQVPAKIEQQAAGGPTGWCPDCGAGPGCVGYCDECVIRRKTNASRLKTRRILDLEESLKELVFTAEKLWDEIKPIKDGPGVRVTHPVIERAKAVLGGEAVVTAHVDPDASPETIAALGEMAQCLDQMVPR